jgi:uncharacterized protein (TIGR02453 family)
MKLDTSIIEFLKDLKFNNNREWFHKNKERYDNANKEFIKFINALTPEIAKMDKRVGILEVKDCLFRIYRDTRFSPDKTPYKLNFGAYMAKGGRKSPFAGYYFHIEPEGSFVSGGIYMPQPEVLKAIRDEIFDNTDEFLKIIEDKTFVKYFKEIQGTKLSTAPKGFPKDFKHIDLLKFKDLYIVRHLSDNQLGEQNLYENIINAYKAMVPLNDFFNKVIVEVTNF